MKACDGLGGKYPFGSNFSNRGSCSNSYCFRLEWLVFDSWQRSKEFFCTYVPESIKSSDQWMSDFLRAVRLVHLPVLIIPPGFGDTQFRRVVHKTIIFANCFVWTCDVVNDIINTRRSVNTNGTTYRGADKSLARPERKQARKHVRDALDFNSIETRAVIKFLPPPCKARRLRKFTPLLQKH